ncbi:TrlF family AAA-like ATPase [Nosocomiicoccus sp. HMSC059G07]|uniref:TrlF family AAA-like ATPase n=1 Tax=Nosocomiicoccus sp. HMSC059G07 TaxID=1739531 RepID=UPI0008A19305|nr:hypothetical protein [Nosocomiicoccus sp. HMSC059G07]OFO56468.1 hypothetical protein HMPREF3029_00120 [Nosocomiicoccus sp. HMSC059G07]
MSISRGSEWRQWDLHVHTASSFDAYKGEDADELLVKAWKDNDIASVAITDHFLIDVERIRRLRELSEDDVVIFPGVELRCDKGASNLHIIIIFPEDCDLFKLSTSFDAIMLEQNAKSKISNDTIYWDFNDIVKFSEMHNGLLSIHTGSKTNGLDKVITNALPVNMAIKEEIASKIHFFELGKKQDIIEYQTHVLPKVGPKPLIICSDNHNPKQYNRKEKLWIKADTSFDGLIQAINHPEERVFVGEIPDKLDKTRKNKSSYIDYVHITRNQDARNAESNWFNYQMPINNGLSVIIGNKGNGKSAFADIIGHLCSANSMSEASFLNDDRFGKAPHKYAEDYSGVISWLDGEKISKNTLQNSEVGTKVQYAQYLPQKFIERVCTDLGDEFQEEINKVIFSYVDSTEKANAHSLEELIRNKSHAYLAKAKEIQNEMDDVNQHIVSIENKLTEKYKLSMQENLDKYQDLLNRHIKNKPKKIKKPVSSLSQEDDELIKNCDERILELEENIETYKTELKTINVNLDILNNAITEVKIIENSINDINNTLKNVKNEVFNNSDEELIVQYTTPKSKLLSKQEELSLKKEKLQKALDDSDHPNEESVYKKLTEQKQIKKNVIEKSDAKEKEYQKYLEDLKEWEEKKVKLEGSEDEVDTLYYYKGIIKKIAETYPNEYLLWKKKRDSMIKELFEQKSRLFDVYSQVYQPIDNELTNLLNYVDESVEFKINLVQKDSDLPSKILSYVNHSYSGIFNGKNNAYVKMNQFIKEANFSEFEGVMQFIDNVMQVVSEDLDKSFDIIKDREGFYRQLCNLDYLGVEFNLNYAGRELSELSPGERGIVLLVFYLALNKGEEPIIIDQPEDNLDNESVYNRLVPCIIEAKKRRQVIIVTHNPNIAIACDAEQVIHSSIDKSKNEITYTAGSIESEEIRNKIIDVLEGTEPAFTLRRKKYLFN